MPNWCSNTLSVTGPAEVLNKFREFADPLSAAKFLPIPEELLNIKQTGKSKGIKPFVGDTRYPSAHVDWDLLYEYERSRMVEDEAIPLSDEEEKALFEKYGARDWREWVSKNWTTDRNFFDCKVEEIGDMFVYRFGTANAPPIGVIEKMAEMYPALSFLFSFGGAEIQSSGSILFLMGHSVLWKNLEYVQDIYDEPHHFCKEFSSSLHKEFPDIYADPNNVTDEKDA